VHPVVAYRSYSGHCGDVWRSLPASDVVDHYCRCTVPAEYAASVPHVLFQPLVSHHQHQRESHLLSASVSSHLHRFTDAFLFTKNHFSYSPYNYMLCIGAVYTIALSALNMPPPPMQILDPPQNTLEHKYNIKMCRTYNELWMQHVSTSPVQVSSHEWGESFHPVADARCLLPSPSYNKQQTQLLLW